MKQLTILILAGLITSMLNLPAFAQQDTLYVYGPGGPLAPMKEAAELFSRQTGTPVKVTAGPEGKWLAQARQNADLIFGGAEYMLTSFMQNNPGLVDPATRVALYRRAAAILVRPGNPKKIRSLKDLTRPGIRLLDVNGAGQLGMWEDLMGRQNLIGPYQQNIKASFANTALGIEAWKSDPGFDAWITYASWHERLKDVTGLVRIPARQTVYRGTPIAITTRTRQRAEAEKFIQFLQTKQAAALFRKWGWD